MHCILEGHEHPEVSVPSDSLWRCWYDSDGGFGQGLLWFGVPLQHGRVARTARGTEATWILITSSPSDVQRQGDWSVLEKVNRR